MKQLSKPNILSWLCAGAGILCLLLRQWLLSTGMEASGLLDREHPGNWLSWLLTALTALAVLLSLRYRTRVRFAPSGLRALGQVLAALGYLAAGYSLGQDSHPLHTPTAVLALISACCCLWMLWGLCRKKRVPPLVYAPGAVFFLLFLVCRYPSWSREPSFQLCFFHIASLGSLALTAYLRGAAALSRKDGKPYLPVSRWAVFASLAAIPGCTDALPLALWALAVLLDGCSPARPRQTL